MSDVVYAGVWLFMAVVFGIAQKYEIGVACVCISQLWVAVYEIKQEINK